MLLCQHNCSLLRWRNIEDGIDKVVMRVKPPIDLQEMLADKSMEVIIGLNHLLAPVERSQESDLVNFLLSFGSCILNAL